MRSAVAIGLLLATLAGCATDRLDRLADLMPTDSDAPDGFRLASSSSLLVGANPGPASGELLHHVDTVAGRPQEPIASLAVVYERAAHPSDRVTVVALRFAEPQTPADWRKYEGAFGERSDGSGGSGGDASDPEDGFAVFYALCGLRPQYGFVRGNDALLVLGAFDEGQDSSREVYGTALDLESTLRGRAGGTPICLPKELAVAREFQRTMESDGDTADESPPSMSLAKDAGARQLTVVMTNQRFHWGDLDVQGCPALNGAPVANRSQDPVAAGDVLQCEPGLVEIRHVPANALLYRTTFD